MRRTLANSATEAPTAHTSPEVRGVGGKRAPQDIPDELHALVVRRQSVPAPSPKAHREHSGSAREIARKCSQLSEPRSQ